MIANQDLNDIEGQWRKMKESANQTIREQKAAPSHHHGIGIDHISAFHWGKEEKETIKKLALHFDPEEILNPGKL